MSIGSLRNVYGTLLNSRAEFEAWAPQMTEAPYKAPPQAPVLYIKPANTWSADGGDIVLPAAVPEVEIGATVALLMKAPGQVAGYLLMNDLSVPHASYFRPPTRFKCPDGFLGIGGTLLAAGAAVDPSRFVLEVRINGELKQTVTFDQLVRTPAQLLAEVGEFMTLGAGDALMLGLGAGRPRARARDLIEITCAGLGRLGNRLVAEAA
ncbi:MAG: fumarylacetoacetate hydrolase [Ramlibacter sp.]|nr:fumarylacetoacetate hydrolase [Ramlibacter sp.]